MTALVYGEMTADRASIVLVAEGPDHEIADAANRCQTLTPLIRPTKPAGGLTLPLTWPAVVQLAATFGGAWRPGPALTGWITEQFGARTATPGELTVPPPAGCVPRPYQVAAARMIALVGSALLFDDPGPQPMTTPILTPDGWSRLGELAPGDVVFDLHGRPSRVRAVKRFGEQDVYRVHLNDRTSTLATAEHRWRVYTANDRKRDNGGRVLSTHDLLERGPRDSGGNARYFLPQQPVLRGLGELVELPLDAYTYGALLGDGSLGGEHLTLTCPDESVVRYVRGGVEQLGTTATWFAYQGRCPGLRFHRDGKLRAALADLDALHPAAAKAVDVRYRHAAESVRRQVLAGLLDTDGSVVGNGTAIEFSSASRTLTGDVAWLARSLGAVVTVSAPQSAGYRDGHGDRVECQDTHRLLARFPADGPNPFRLPRKADAWAAMAAGAQRRHPPRTIRAIEPAGRAEVCCIELDTDDEASRVYLTDSTLIPTHNTGKTVSAVLGLVERHAARHPVLPVVVVCPNAVVDSWVEHVTTWTPGWRAVAWRGSPKRRRNLAGTADVYVAGYSTASRDAATADMREVFRGKAPLLSLGARFVIADEVHRIKGQSTAQSWAVRRLAAKADAAGGGFVGLSGTPITHSPKDLWPALHCMDPGAYPSSERWALRYCDTLPGDYGAPKVLGLNDAREPEFRQTVLGQYRRVAKADVLAELPPKVYSVRHVELPTAWRKVYDDVEASMLAELPDEPGTELEVMGVLAQLTRLLQLASSAADVAVTEETVPDPLTGVPTIKRHQHVTLKAPSWKVDELLEVLDERPGAQVAAYAPSRQLMMLAGAAATAAGYRVGYIVGQQTARERTAAVEAFQAGRLDLICVTTGAGGVGITLTAASTAVFLQRPWSLVEALQAEDRQHRIGSERHECIEIVDIVATNTIETRVRKVLTERADQLSKLVEDRRIVAELLGGAKVRDQRKKAAA